MEFSFILSNGLMAISIMLIVLNNIIGFGIDGGLLGFVKVVCVVSTIWSIVGKFVSKDD